MIPPVSLQSGLILKIHSDLTEWLTKKSWTAFLKEFTKNSFQLNTPIAASNLHKISRSRTITQYLSTLQEFTFLSTLDISSNSWNIIVARMLQLFFPTFQALLILFLLKTLPPPPTPPHQYKQQLLSCKWVTSQYGVRLCGYNNVT